MVSAVRLCLGPEFFSHLIQVNAPRSSFASLGLRLWEESMQMHKPRSTGTAPRAKHDELFECRMEMLGLEAVENGHSLDEVRRCCSSCGYREACAVDLKRDPNSPVWETYCPNTTRFIVLAEESWLLK
jgi:hypothetical protein